MNIKTLDKNLAATIRAKRKPPISEAKRLHQIEERRLLRERIRNIGLDSRAATLLADVLNTEASLPNPTASDAMPTIRELRGQELIATASALFERWSDVFRELPVQEITTEAPDAKALEAWRKRKVMRVDEMEEKLLSDPPATYETSGADWILLRAKPERSLPILRLFLRRLPRPKCLPQWAAVIGERLRLDKRGLLLGCAISAASENASDLKALAEVVRLDRSLLLMVARLLPKIASQRNAGTGVVEFAREILSAVIESHGSDREFLTAVLAQLGSGMLLERQSEQTKACLEFVQQTARQLRNLTSEEDLRSKTWVLENLCGEELPRERALHITIDGARQLAIAMDKAQQGFDAKEILAVAARNLGLLPIGKKGETVSFSPIRHQDVEGGMLPGDAAQIEEGGWSYQDDVIVRAKVKPNKD